MSTRAPNGTREGSDKGKPVARPGRKATGLSRETAGLPKNLFRESAKWLAVMAMRRRQGRLLESPMSPPTMMDASICVRAHRRVVTEHDLKISAQSLSAQSLSAQRASVPWKATATQRVGCLLQCRRGTEECR